MNESINGERTASEPQDRSSSVAHSIEVPSEIIQKWQEIVNLLAEIMHVPSASIMRVDPPHIKVFVSSTSEGNPCEPGALDTGPYCETVMKTGQPLLIPDALENEAWKANPYLRLGLVSYLGVPIGWPNGRIFGTICVRDNKRNEYSEAYLKLLLHFRDMLQADLKSHGEIEERETKIRRLLDSNIMGVFIWDFDGRILEANDEFLRMVGYDREDLISGRVRWADLTPPDWRDRNNARIEQQKSSGRFDPFEKEFTRKDGSRVPILIGGATFEEGGNQGVAFVLDLTERKCAEEALREREAKIRRLVDSNIIGIFIWDFDGRILEANDEFLRMVDYDREDLVSGRIRWTDLTPPDWRERDNAKIEQQKISGRLEPFEKEYTRKDGSRVPVLIGVATFEDGGNQSVAFVLDLTERKRAEQALRESERSSRSALDGIAGLVAIMTPNGELETVNRQCLEYFGL